MIIRFMRFIFLSTIVFVMFSNISVAREEAETSIGRIVEISPSENIIQVGNRNFIVTEVYVDDGTREDPVRGFFYNLDVGKVVEVVYHEKNREGFWKAEKVILYVGDRLEDILAEMRKVGVEI